MKNTKEKVATAVKVLSGRKNFHKITIKDITMECQMTRESYYYHFQDKTDAIFWIANHDIIEKLPQEEISFEDWLYEFLNLLFKDYLFYGRMLKSEDHDLFFQIFTPIFEEQIEILIERDMELMRFRVTNDDEEFVEVFYAHAFLSAIADSLMNNRTMDVAKLWHSLKVLIENFFSLEIR